MCYILVKMVNSTSSDSKATMAGVIASVRDDGAPLGNKEGPNLPPDRGGVYCQILMPGTDTAVMQRYLEANMGDPYEPDPINGPGELIQDVIKKRMWEIQLNDFSPSLLATMRADGVILTGIDLQPSDLGNALMENKTRTRETRNFT